MSLQTPRDWEGMAAIARIVADTLQQMKALAKPGMSTKELDDLGSRLLKDQGARSAPTKDYHFPGATCISVNHQVAHGIPSSAVILQEGDLINIDVSAEKDGYYGDNGASFILGVDHKGLSPLVAASQTILMGAIYRIRAGQKISETGKYIEQQARKMGFATICNLTGHGIGRKLHEEPREIPNYFDRFNRQRFKKNTTVAIETFISTKAKVVEELHDGWTLATMDGSYVAQHEHTIVVTDGAPVILTLNNGIA
ncbi:MAG: type I methionyl aminopeptidase [Saprospiraceae bacterium]|nr:type I methionyl aminopeptidase [Saprospiraceae bacterium]MCB9318100.1 type I methionyl aminopeptidase [Lewinellaceae bacterium]